MKGSALPLFAFASLIHSCIGFKASFYSGNNCNGKFLGSKGMVSHITDPNGNTAYPMCSKGDEFPGTASSVYIEGSRQENDDGDAFVFFKKGNCKPENAVASANTGCINIGIGGDDHDWTHYKALSGDNQANLHQWGKRGGLVDEKIEVNIEKRAKKAMKISTLQHGDFAEQGGEVFRYKQIFNDVFIGVSPEDWQEKPPTAVEGVVEFGSDYPFNFTAHRIASEKRDAVGDADAVTERGLEVPGKDMSRNPTHGVLEARDRVITCAGWRNCVRGLAIYTEYAFPVMTADVVNAIVAIANRSPGDNVWSILKSRLAFGVYGGLIAGTVVGRYNLAGTANPQPCPGLTDEAKILEKLINKGMISKDVIHALNQEVMKEEGASPEETGILTMSLIPNGAHLKGSFCGAQPTPFIPHRMSRTKRAMYVEIPGFEEWLVARHGDNVEIYDGEEEE